MQKINTTPTNTTLKQKLLSTAMALIIISTANAAQANKGYISLGASHNYTPQSNHSIRYFMPKGNNIPTTVEKAVGAKEGKYNVLHQTIQLNVLEGQRMNSLSKINTKPITGEGFNISIGQSTNQGTANFELLVATDNHGTFKHKLKDGEMYREASTQIAGRALIQIKQQNPFALYLGVGLGAQITRGDTEAMNNHLATTMMPLSHCKTINDSHTQVITMNNEQVCPGYGNIINQEQLDSFAPLGQFIFGTTIQTPNRRLALFAEYSTNIIMGKIQLSGTHIATTRLEHNGTRHKISAGIQYAVGAPEKKPAHRPYNHHTKYTSGNNYTPDTSNAHTEYIGSYSRINTQEISLRAKTPKKKTPKKKNSKQPSNKLTANCKE